MIDGMVEFKLTYLKDSYSTKKDENTFFLKAPAVPVHTGTISL